jgi:hypothetical protein
MIRHWHWRKTDSRLSFGPTRLLSREIPANYFIRSANTRASKNLDKANTNNIWDFASRYILMRALKRLKLQG